MSAQPEALRLALALNMSAPFVDGHINHAAAAELRRLNSVNAELLESLNQLVKAVQRANDLSTFADTYARESVSFQMYDAIKTAHAAIAKATGEQA